MNLTVYYQLLTYQMQRDHITKDLLLLFTHILVRDLVILLGVKVGVYCGTFSVDIECCTIAEPYV